MIEEKNCFQRKMKELGESLCHSEEWPWYFEAKKKLSHKLNKRVNDIKFNLRRKTFQEKNWLEKEKKEPEKMIEAKILQTSKKEFKKNYEKKAEGKKKCWQSNIWRVKGKIKKKKK